ncbi:hypothetical protein [Pelagibius sp.]|uniref:hypothetical protein n=1 Tax=Pelagibius sp. TaxID=1931238 RepID=UPI00261D03FB|nr:hypothetical protein [Pelagibius sp.]
MPVPSGFWWLATAYLTALKGKQPKADARAQTIELCCKDQHRAGLSDGEGCEAYVDAVISALERDLKDLDPKERLPFAKIRELAGGEDYDLWKYFQGRSDMVKARLWTTITWLISAQAGFLALLFSTDILAFTEETRIQIAICLPIPAFVLSLLGVGLSLYSLFVIYDAFEHMTWNWTRANLISQESDHSEKPKWKKSPYLKPGFFIPTMTCAVLCLVFVSLMVVSASQLSSESSGHRVIDRGTLGSCAAEGFTQGEESSPCEGDRA